MAMTKILPRGINKHMAYTIAEIVAILRVDQRTVFRWIDESGLKTVPGGQKPILISGGELSNFLTDKNTRNKSGPLKRDEFYCLRCRAPRRAKRASKTVVNGKTLALCVVCSSKMSRTNKPSHQDYMKPLFPT